MPRSASASMISWVDSPRSLSVPSLRICSRYSSLSFEFGWLAMASLLAAHRASGESPLPDGSITDLLEVLDR